jgi:phosphohistidine phosphatase
MLLLLVRHADAGDRDPAQWPDDRDRPLTEKGRKVQRRVSKALLRFDLVPTLVLSSPWTRAAQTAQVMVETLGLGPAVPCEPLAAEPDLIRLTDYVGEQGADARVALVGHSPWIEELAAILLGGTSVGVRIDFPKSGVMGVDAAELAPGAGELQFFLRPKMAKNSER